MLVCNAASNPYYGPNEKLPDDVFMKVMQNNILSNMWLINLCLPDMRAKKDGSIMIVSSIGGVRGEHGDRRLLHLQGGRHAARAQPRAEYGPDNIRVNTIAPGLVTTDFARRCGTIRKYLAKRLETARRCAASASPTTSAAWRSCWPARPAPSSPARR